uniref:Uncharacterized protein n=1 Tax=Arundo donax TaxID=35708 RepID=A0A0A8Z7L7_ARUDO
MLGTLLATRTICLKYANSEVIKPYFHFRYQKGQSDSVLQPELDDMRALTT